MQSALRGVFRLRPDRWPYWLATPADACAEPNPSAQKDLESLTQVVHEARTDNGSGQAEQGDMNVQTPLEANAQLTKTGKPGVRALDYPAMPSEPLAVFYAATGDACSDCTLLQIASAAGKAECSLLGRLRGEPFKPGTAGRVSRVRSNALESCRLAPVTVIAKGGPRASTTRCRLLPSLPRFVGLGPVSWPPGGWQRWPHPGSFAPNQSGHVHATGKASPDAACSPRLRPASRAIVASMSCRCPSRAPAASLPMERRYAGHTGCRSMPPGRQQCADARLSVRA